MFTIASNKFEGRDRIITARLDTKPKDTVIRCVNMFTSSHTNEDVEEVYDKIDEILRTVKWDKNLILLSGSSCFFVFYVLNIPSLFEEL